MRIPDKVKIGTITYDVSKTENTLELNNKVCSGVIHYEDALIELNTKRNYQKMEQTFLHEVIHGIVRERGLEWGENDELYTDEIATGVYALIKDNPDMFKVGDKDE